jgi:hypothetical protein
VAGQHIVYAREGRPDIEVLVDGDWVPGALMMRTQDSAATWWDVVEFTHTPLGLPGRIVLVAEERVRPRAAARSRHVELSPA